MTRTELINLVVENTRRSDKQASMLKWLSLGLREISQRHDFKTNRVETDDTLVANANSVSIPADCFQMLQVRLIDSSTSSTSRNVELKDKQWVTERVPNLSEDTEGWPVYCFENDEDGTLVFVPPTSQEWTVRMTYFRLNPELSLSTDTPDAAIENALVSWLTAYTFKSTQQFPDAQFWMNDYERSLRIAISADERTHTIRRMEGFTQQRVSQPLAPPHLDPWAKDSEGNSF